uniref:Niv5 n=1 Tax=Streptomyces sp. Ls2151 TaxID=1030489 RepID=U5XPE4_9ACTN|nr:Niv5 [Streptomyces sp. Ls2151]
MSPDGLRRTPVGVGRHQAPLQRDLSGPAAVLRRVGGSLA